MPKSAGEVGGHLDRDELIAHAINSNDGWGKIPVRQDTMWEITPTDLQPNAAKLVPIVDQTVAKPSVGTNGTAIWEASKENLPVAGVHVGAVGTAMLSSPVGVVPPNSNSPGWDMSRAVGNRTLPSSHLVAASDSGPWNLPSVGKEVPTLGSIWDVGSVGAKPWSLQSASDKLEESSGGSNRLGLNSQPVGILGSIENVQSPSSAVSPWTRVASLLTDTNHEFASATLDASANCLPLSGQISSSGTSPASAASEIWSQSGPPSNRLSSLSWGDSGTDSIWNPLPLVSQN